LPFFKDFLSYLKEPGLPFNSFIVGLGLDVENRSKIFANLWGGFVSATNASFPSEICALDLHDFSLPLIS
jgi:hypothetical protein